MRDRRWKSGERHLAAERPHRARPSNRVAKPPMAGRGHSPSPHEIRGALCLFPPAPDRDSRPPRRRQGWLDRRESHARGHLSDPAYRPRVDRLLPGQASSVAYEVLAPPPCGTIGPPLQEIVPPARSIGLAGTENPHFHAAPRLPHAS